MKILVTGGCGFIGSNFIKHMLDKYDYEITNLDSLTYAGNRDNLGEYENHHNYYFAQGDINETDFLKVIIETKEIDTIVNFAAESHVDRSIVNPDDFIKSNIDGTYNLLRLLHEYPMKKFIQISTDEVYGSLQEDDEAFTEKTSIFPSSPYAASKASADLLCFSFFHTHNYPIIVTRCSNNYGPNQYPEKLIPLMIQKAKNNERLRLDKVGDINDIIKNGKILTYDTHNNLISETIVENNVVKKIIKIKKSSGMDPGGGWWEGGVGWGVGGGGG